MQDRFIRWPDVKTSTGLSRATIWRLEKAGKFPRRKLIGAKSIAWLQSEISAWMETRATVGRGKS